MGKAALERQSDQLQNCGGEETTIVGSVFANEPRGFAQGAASPSLSASLEEKLPRTKRSNFASTFPLSLLANLHTDLFFPPTKRDSTSVRLKGTGPDHPPKVWRDFWMTNRIRLIGTPPHQRSARSVQHRTRQITRHLERTPHARSATAASNR